jgi:hypothetical protein
MLTQVKAEGGCRSRTSATIKVTLGASSEVEEDVQMRAQWSKSVVRKCDRQNEFGVCESCRCMGRSQVEKRSNIACGMRGSVSRVWR